MVVPEVIAEEVPEETLEEIPEATPEERSQRVVKFLVV